MDVSHMEKQFIAMNVSVYVGEDLPRSKFLFTRARIYPAVSFCLRGRGSTPQ